VGQHRDGTASRGSGHRRRGKEVKDWIVRGVSRDDRRSSTSSTGSSVVAAHRSRHRRWSRWCWLWLCGAMRHKLWSGSQQGLFGAAAVPAVAAAKTDPERFPVVSNRHHVRVRSNPLALRGGDFYSFSATAESESAVPWGLGHHGTLGLEQRNGRDEKDFFGLTSDPPRNWDVDEDDIEGIGFDEDEPLLWAGRRRSRRGVADSDPHVDDDVDVGGKGHRQWIRKRVRRIHADAFVPTSAETTTAAAAAPGNDMLVPPASRYRTTGTTIAGIVVHVDDDEAEDDGDIHGRAIHDRSAGVDSDLPQATQRRRRTRTVVILGADTRATAGRIVADKNASKIHELASNLFACGAGTSADLMHITRQAQFTFRLANSYARDVGNDNVTLVSSPASEEVIDDTKVAMSVNVHAACRWLQSALYEQGGSCQANLIVGGVQVPPDRSSVPTRNGGPREAVAILRAIHPHGSSDDVKFAALGSGGLAAMAVLESRYRPRYPSLQEAIRLVTDAIRAGISNDLGSGSSIDLCILDSATGRVTHIRSAVPEEVLSSPPTSMIKDDESSSGHSPQAEVGSMPGVNGFGNVPFTVRSARTIQRYYDEDDDDGIESAWDEILGLH
jgi:20S proteasome alpha/beta subunit